MARTYGTEICRICGRAISVAGAPYAAHMRLHVREGRLEERTRFYARPGHPTWMRRFVVPGSTVLSDEVRVVALQR